MRGIAIAVLLGACHRGPTCEQVVDHLDAVSPPGMWMKEPRDVLLGRCAALKPETRTCIVEADRFAPMMDCYHLER